MNAVHEKMIFIHFTAKDIISIMETEIDDTIKKGAYEMKEHVKNYNGSVFKTKIQDFYNELISMIKGVWITPMLLMIMPHP